MVSKTQPNSGVIANTVNYVQNNKLKTFAIATGAIVAIAATVIGVRAGLSAFSAYMAPQGCARQMFRDPENVVRTYKYFACPAAQPTVAQAAASSVKGDLNSIVSAAQTAASTVAGTATSIANAVASAAKSFGNSVSRSYKAFSDVSYDASCKFVNETAHETNPFLRNVHFTCPKA